MPLPDDDWTRGKSSFKMLQYMACGIPVIVSPIGMNKDVLAMDSVGLSAVTEQDWFDGLTIFYSNRAQARAFGRAGRAVVEATYSQEAVTPQLAEIFHKLA